MHVVLLRAGLDTTVDPSSRIKLRSIFTPKHGRAIDRPRNNIDIGPFWDLIIKELSLSDSLARGDGNYGVEPENFAGDSAEE